MLTVKTIDNTEVNTLWTHFHIYKQELIIICMDLLRKSMNPQMMGTSLSFIMDMLYIFHVTICKTRFFMDPMSRTN